jgi:hypothetical protein
MRLKWHGLCLGILESDSAAGLFAGGGGFLLVNGEGVKVSRAALSALVVGIAVATAAYGSPVCAPAGNEAAVAPSDERMSVEDISQVQASRPESDAAAVYAALRGVDTEVRPSEAKFGVAMLRGDESRTLPEVPGALALLATGAICLCIAREWRRARELPGRLYKVAHAGVRTLPKLAGTFASKRVSRPRAFAGHLMESIEAALTGETPELVFVGLLRKMSIPGVSGRDFSCLHAQSAVRAA